MGGRDDAFTRRTHNQRPAPGGMRSWPACLWVMLVGLGAPTRPKPMRNGPRRNFVRSYPVQRPSPMPPCRRWRRNIPRRRQRASSRLFGVIGKIKPVSIAKPLLSSLIRRLPARRRSRIMGFSTPRPVGRSRAHLRRGEALCSLVAAIPRLDLPLPDARSGCSTDSSAKRVARGDLVFLSRWLAPEM